VSAAALIASPLIWILALVALQRLGELVLSRRNTRRLLAQGGREVGAGHYPAMIALHASWLVAIAATTPLHRQPDWLLIAVFAAMQLTRLWIVAALGTWWTTRVITVDAAPLVRTGPFRFLRHPNYWVVAVEVAVLPLAFGNWPVALIWSALNGLMLMHRIRIEDAALAPRAERG
jgi:methyltransferase